MNERIKELAEQAGLGKERWNTTEQFNSFLAKFSELIVRECIESVNEDMYSGAGYHSDFSSGADWALETAIDNIKEKFGVE